ncbi:MAG: hypothetical protein M3Q75_01500 [Gemmatimonadota bacterium]|nr:hypothetical protein [Gemmatimonadota bacterium]
MNLLTLSLGTIVDRALQEVRNQYEVGRPCVRNEGIDVTLNTFTMNVSANISDILEFGNELMLVTAKSGDLVPIYTVVRGYFGTTAIVHVAGEPGLINPTFTRKSAADGALRSFSAMQAGDLPILTTAQYTVVADPNDMSSGVLVVALPEDTLDVWYVRHGFEDIPRFRYMEYTPTATYSTGKVLALPYGWDVTWKVDVTRQTAYRWSTHPAAPVEASTIQVPEGGEYLPSTYASAFLLTNREVSRSEIDRSEEFGRTVGIQQGVTRSVVRDAWQTFYRKLDEARRQNPPQPPMRPYVTWAR